jgi:alpha-L-arabinofuranosidase
MNFLNRQLLVLALMDLCFHGTNMIFSQTSNSICVVDVSKPGAEVAPICRGQELEEFNHGIEGGLYAQLINNPSFEEVVNDSGVSFPTRYWDVVVPGSSAGRISGQTSANTHMLNTHQIHCVKLSVASVASGSVGIKSDGFWGMKLENMSTYQVSFWAKKGPDYSGILTAKLESSDGKAYASQSFTPTSNWAHYSCNLIPAGITSVSGNNRFVIYASSTGDVFFDVVTVMPPSWKNHGCRIDIAEKVDSLHLKFLDYPGGLDALWSNPEHARMWKESIGPKEQRGGSTNYGWGYKNDLYFGTDEYFQLAEDLGAEPCYVFTAGILTDITDKPVTYAPIDSLMRVVIPDILDFMEYCNGDTNTIWGAKRKANGHENPYNLKYVQIGAENNHNPAIDSAAYAQRYKLIHDSLIAHYPDLRITFNGNYLGGVSHPEGQPCWCIDDHHLSDDNSHKYNFYDDSNQDPGISKFKIQEYCSSHMGMAANVVADFSDAIADAIFMLGCEKNSQRMWWTGYGNFGSVINHGDFGDNLLNFDAVSCFGCPAYYMQKMLFSDNQGTHLLHFTQNTDHCYLSASIDSESGKNDILLKVVNNKGTSEIVNITLHGSANINEVGHSITLTGAPDDKNSITYPTKVIPKTNTFTAGKSFKYEFPANSITVLRINVKFKEVAGILINHFNRENQVHPAELSEICDKRVGDARIYANMVS